MESWSNLCRCCLSPNSEVSLLNKEQNVKRKFLDITTIEVKENDGLPQKLCSECFSILNSAYQFRTQCMKMNKELRVQLTAIAQKGSSPQYSQIEAQVKANEDITIEDIAKESMKQIESIIKSEPMDDDDYYYVLVIDNPNDEKKDSEEKKDTIPVKQEVEQESETESQGSQFADVDSFLVSSPRVPPNVPATILENEEQAEEFEVEIDNSEPTEQELSVTDKEFTVITKPLSIDRSDITIIEKQNDNLDNQEKPLDEFCIELTEKDLENSKNCIKILSPSGQERAIFLKNNDSIKYLTDTHLMKGDDMQQQEVIFCEGDDSSQFQILKCDGSELVIEYTDEGQIATVLQQEDGTFLCDCGEQFDDLSQYEQHQYKHNPAGDLLCNLCGKGFETPEILTGHKLLHNVDTVLVKCPFCSQFVKRNTLTQHIKYTHNNKPQCNVCQKTFANQNNLKRHMMIHKGIREFECDICHKRFGQKITMQTHRLTHVNPFFCNNCGRVFADKDLLSAHKEGDQCSSTKVQKVKEVKEELMKTVKQEITTSVGKLLGYACSLCKKMFSLESALEKHIEVTHIFEDINLEDGENKKIAKRFACSICGKGCASQAMLIMHERVHTNERPFPCHLCSLRFKTKTHLRTHQLTHTREKKFGCSVCMKFFALKGNLVVHLRTHTGERPYICSICNEAFIDSKYLKKHKLKKHAIDNNLPWNKYSP